MEGLRPLEQLHRFFVDTGDTRFGLPRSDLHFTLNDALNLCQLYFETIEPPVYIPRSEERPGHPSTQNTGNQQKKSTICGIHETRVHHM